MTPTSISQAQTDIGQRPPVRFVQLGGLAFRVNLRVLVMIAIPSVMWLIPQLARGFNPQTQALSVSLVPVLMPLLARIRHFLDLDAEPAAIDAHLAQPRSQGLGLRFAHRRKRNVLLALVASFGVPRGFAVAGEQDSHARALRESGCGRLTDHARIPACRGRFRAKRKHGLAAEFSVHRKGNDRRAAGVRNAHCVSR